MITRSIVRFDPRRWTDDGVLFDELDLSGPVIVVYDVTPRSMPDVRARRFCPVYGIDAFVHGDEVLVW